MAYFWKLSPEDFEGLTLRRIQKYAEITRRISREVGGDRG
nr:MAG TPA: hypothetical protein [Caudoviricetes sp.]